MQQLSKNAQVYIFIYKKWSVLVFKMLLSGAPMPVAIQVDHLLVLVQISNW